MIRCQNSIVTVNVQSVHRQLQAPTQPISSLIWEVFHNLVNRSLWQVARDNVKHFLEFNYCFRHCFKLAVSLQFCTPHVIVHWVYIRQIGGHWSFEMKSGQLACSQFRALCTVCAGAPFCWKMNPVGSRRLFWKNDKLVIIYKQHKLLFTKALLRRHRQ